MMPRFCTEQSPTILLYIIFRAGFRPKPGRVHSTHRVVVAGVSLASKSLTVKSSPGLTAGFVQ